MRGTLNPTTGAEDGQAQGARVAEAPVLDAIAAYDLVAPGYGELSERRRAYLDAVDEEIVRRVPEGAASLIDIGAGDGRRALKIAAGAKIPRVVLVEPSKGMRRLIPAGSEVWDGRIEALAVANHKFDVVSCLWNVLGHVPNRELRVAALRNLGQLCSAGGLIFLDVINRYNVAECGIQLVARRILLLHDGDVPVKWRIGASRVQAVGHVFSSGEIQMLLREAGLSALERVVLDYRTGRHRRLATSGNLFYVLRPSRS